MVLCVYLQKRETVEQASHLAVYSFPTAPPSLSTAVQSSAPADSPL